MPACPLVPPLLPRPKRLAATGGTVAVPPVLTVSGVPADLLAACLGGRARPVETGAWVRCAVDPGQVAEPGSEAYRLTIASSGVDLAARTATGLRLGLATLAQLAVVAELPCLVVDDAPAFTHRGVMLDISRARVPTMATLYDLVERMASWKLNHLQLYTEHTIAYRGHQEVWAAASPLTFDELDALDRHCRLHGIELTANQNCLGHFERWLRVPRYTPLGELGAGEMINGQWYALPNTLCPTDPRSLELIADLLGQQLPHCSGAFANICCDEPWGLGRGRSREACERIGTPAVFSAYVAQVAGIARRLGKRPMFWCDPHPNEGDGLPGDLVALIWGYEDTDGFATRIREHQAAGREAWVAPGTSCWNAVTGRTWNRRGNLDRAAAEGMANGVPGFLNTAWGDGGHRQQWPLTLFGFADGAMASWSGPGCYDDAAAGAHACATPELGAWLARLGDVDAELCQGRRRQWDGTPQTARACSNHTALWKELHVGLLEPTGIGDLAAWQEIAGRLERLAAEMPVVPDVLVADECRHTVAVARWIASRAIARRSGLDAAARKRLVDGMLPIVDEFRRLWLARSRYGGLEEATPMYANHIWNG
jgi:hexosaminidase